MNANLRLKHQIKKNYHNQSISYFLQTILNIISKLAFLTLSIRNSSFQPTLSTQANSEKRRTFFYLALTSFTDFCSFSDRYTPKPPIITANLLYSLKEIERAMGDSNPEPN